MPTNIKQHAEENLRFIRGAMERAEGVSSVSGIGGMLMGVSALCAMAMAARLPSLSGQLILWVYTAFLAVLLVSVASYLKARRIGSPFLQGDSSRRFLLCLLPVLLVGAILSWSLWSTPQLALLPGLWMMLYGCGLLSAGTYTVQPIMLTGAGFIIAGLFSYALPVAHSNIILGACFGGLHIISGYWIYKHHGG